MLKFTNNASATLAGAITSAATSIVLTSGNGSLFPALGAGEFFYATLVDSSNNLEVVKVTARSTDTLTVTRAQDNTVARAYSVGDKFERRVVAADFAEFIQRDGSVPMTAALNHGGFKATGMADPSVATDGATKNYTDVAIAAEATARSNADAAEVTARNSAISTAVASEATARANADAGKANTGGNNASGTWPISISGTAAGVPWSGVSGQPTALSQFSNNIGAVTSATAANTYPVAVNCGNINQYTIYKDSGTSVRLGYYATNCNCCCCC